MHRFIVLVFRAVIVLVCALGGGGCGSLFYSGLDSHDFFMYSDLHRILSRVMMRGYIVTQNAAVYVGPGTAFQRRGSLPRATEGCSGDAAGWVVCCALWKHSRVDQ